MGNGMDSSSGKAIVRGGYVDTLAGQVHYRECGEGAPLVLMHPAPRSSLVFMRLLQALGDQGGVRAIAIDLPGFGNSCALEPGTSMHGVAGLVLEAIDGLGIRTVSLFGVHSGNKVAAALAAENPLRIDACVFVGMTHSLVIDIEARNAAMREAVRSKPPTDPAKDPQAWRNEQIDTLNGVGNDALYAANFAFDFTAALRRVQARSLVIELEVPEEAHLGRQADAVVAMMPHARAMQRDGDDTDWLQVRPAELAGIVKSYLSDSQQ